MSMTFTKLFSSITESTIWVEPHETRIVWITMLAMADAHGRVWGSVPGLANRARVTVEECEAALTRFKSPDKYSRTKDHDGKRIEDIDGGWRLLNHAKYRAIRDEEAIKESKRKYINTRRELERVENVERSRAPKNPVDCVRAIAEAYSEAESEAKADKPIPIPAPSGSAREEEDFFARYVPPANLAPTPKPTPAPAVRKPRPQDETLNALATVAGGIASEVPPSRWSFVQKCLKDIRAVCPDVTPDEIRTRARNYRARFSGCLITPEALAKHWATCGSHAKGEIGQPGGPALR